MNEFLILIIVIGLFTIMFLSIVFWISWSVHRDMVKCHCIQWDYGDFETFLNEFEETKWENQDRQPKSMFDYNTKSQIHASIIQFRGKGMVLYPWSWFRFKIFERKHIYKQTRVKGLWAE